MKPISLSFPPSVNNLFATVGRHRVPTARYKAWRQVAALELARQHPPRLTGPYRLTIVATRPDRRARDISNIAKALEDLLVSAGCVRDDSDAISIHLEWSAAAPDKTAGVQIVLEAA